MYKNYNNYVSSTQIYFSSAQIYKYADIFLQCADM